ncbi:MAG: hypothetical protein ACKPKO_01575, partial [Candidatus Fonsibacter sp.]
MHVIVLPVMVAPVIVPIDDVMLPAAVIDEPTLIVVPTLVDPTDEMFTPADCPFVDIAPTAII